MTPEIESLLRDEGWVRALARALVRDAARADDLVQEAWLAARRAPTEEEPAARRRWLGAVLRNRARQDQRAELRRAERERRAARPEAAEGPQELLERLELRERVVRAVRELEEPYRTAILLRWFEGLSPREIARRKGVPRRTVHSWLHRGLALLRTKLRAELGSQRAWLAALLPLCDPPAAPLAPIAAASSAAPAIGALAMTLQSKLVAAGALGAVLFVTYLALPERSGREPLAPKEGLAAPLQTSRPAEPRVDEPATAAPAGALREAVARVAEPASEPDSPPPPQRHIAHGLIVDVENRPLGGVALWQVTGDGKRLARMVSASDGTFELETEVMGGELVLDDPRWTPVLRPVLFRGAKQMVLIVAPRIELGGVVIGPGGESLAGARVGIDFDQDLRAHFPHVLDTSRVVRHEVRSDDQGRFELSDVPGTRYAKLRVDLEGFRVSSSPVPLASTWDLIVELADKGQEVRLLTGRVLGPEGRPVPGAWVGLDGETTRSGEDGGFVLEISERGATGVLWAAVAGRAPARLAREGDSNLAPQAWPDPLELVVEGEPGSIRGRVLDAEGAPVAQAKVRVLDPTPFGAVPFEEGEGTYLLIGADLESLLSGHRWSYGGTASDEQGRFGLQGLAQREYSVEVTDPVSLTHAIRVLAPGPDEVEIHLPQAAPARRVAGRVVHSDGQPAPGVRVTLSASLPERSDGSSRIEGPMLQTGEDGRFEFEAASASATHLRVQGSAMGENATIALPEGDVQDLELLLPRTAHLQVELADPAEADAFGLLDVRGQRLDVIVQQGNIAWGQHHVSIVDGRSLAVRSHDLARELVLYRAGQEVRRVPLALVPGELSTVVP